MAKAKAAPEPTIPEPTTMVGVRMTVSFKEWLEKLVQFDRRGSVASLLEIAAVRYATELKMPEPPPVRMP